MFARGVAARSFQLQSKPLIIKVDEVVLGSFSCQSRPDLPAGYSISFMWGPTNTRILGTLEARHKSIKSYHSATSGGCSSLDQ